MAYGPTVEHTTLVRAAKASMDATSWLSPVTETHCDTLLFEFLAEDWRRKRQLDLND